MRSLRTAQTEKPTMITLRDYQQDAVQSAYAYWQNNTSCIIEAPCGAGKSLIIGKICHDSITHDVRVLVVTHRKKLLEQNEAELKNLLPDADTGFYSAGLNQKTQDAQIVFAGIQSIANATIQHYEILIIDECHLVAPNESGQYHALISKLKEVNPDLKILGLTATPYRLDSGYLTEWETPIFERVVYKIDVKLLIKRGYLCPVVSNGGGVKVDVSKVKHKGGEFLDSALESLYMSKTVEIVADIVKKGIDRKAWLIFCVSIEHAEQVTTELISHGIDAACYHSQSDNEYILDDFANGRLKCLVNVNILTTGSNFPIADMCVLLRATESTALYVQIVGRVMRLYPNKKNALLLDYGGNVLRHGCIDDVAVKAKGEGTGEAPAKECPSCETILHAAVRECPECGYIFEREPDKKLELNAFDGAVLSDQRKVQKVPVDRVSFKIHKKIGKPDSIKVTYHCGMAEYYEWLTPENSEFGLKKTHAFFRNIDDDYFESSSVSIEFLEDLNAIRHSKKITSIDILPSKYTEVKKRYWSKV